MNKKKLGFGLMRLPLVDPEDRGSIDIEQVKKMVDLFIQRGYTYFDTAWMYCDFQSENAAKEALVSRYPRDSFTLATKLHSAYIKTEDDRDKVFNTQLEKTGAGFFDYYLLHDVNIHSIETYEKLNCFEWLKAKKEAGLVRHMGFSFHDTPELLDKVLTEHPEVEFVQIQLNYLDYDSEAIQSRRCYETATKHGKAVIVMEPVKGGTLAKVEPSVEAMFKAYAPEASASSWAIRFAASHENVMMVLSGMSTLEQLSDNTSFMADFKPLNEQERDIIKRVVAIINGEIAIPCTGCSYCTDGCPMNIAIPKYFALYNMNEQSIKDNGWQSHGEYYDNLTKTYGKASDCISCGQCEAICPQHLPIREHLKSVAKLFE